MAADKVLLVFCASSYEIDPVFNEVAREVVRAASLKGYDIASGGTVKGTMGVVADEAERCGVGNIGVIPHFMQDVLYPRLTRVVWTDTMSERKEKMREVGSAAAVALPGGIGTMDELFETYTLAKLGKYNGRVIAFNYKGFYDGLKHMLDHFVETKMLDERTRNLIFFPETAQELSDLL